MPTKQILAAVCAATLLVGACSGSAIAAISSAESACLDQNSANCMYLHSQDQVKTLKSKERISKHFGLEGGYTSLPNTKKGDHSYS